MQYYIKAMQTLKMTLQPSQSEKHPLQRSYAGLHNGYPDPLFRENMNRKVGKAELNTNVDL